MPLGKYSHGRHNNAMRECQHGSYFLFEYNMLHQYGIEYGLRGNDMVTNHKQKHRASVLIKVQVSEMHPQTRESTGRLVQKDVLSQHGIKPKQVVNIEGFSCEECLRKLRLWIESANK